MTTVTIETICPSVPGGGPHMWLWHESGRGCAYCPAWVPYTRDEIDRDDPHPTQFPALLAADFPPLAYGQDMPTTPTEPADLDIEVLGQLLPVLGPDVSWQEALTVANTVIEIVRARS